MSSPDNRSSAAAVQNELSGLSGRVSYKDAIRAALDDALTRDSSVLFLGEDIGGAGGVFGCSAGLLEKHGPTRVIDTPISEFGFCEVALGLAITGMRPIVEIMFADFLGVAASPIAVDFPRYRLTSGGQVSVPVTIRTVGGIGWHFGAQHSMTYESWLQSMPGLRIAVSSRPSSAYANITAAVGDDNPVLIIEHKMALNRSEVIDATVPLEAEIGKAHVLREGDDVTIVASLNGVWTALDAAGALADQGVQAEVVDIAWIKPLDVATVARSVARTGRLVILMEDYFAGSWASTLIAHLTLASTAFRAAPFVFHLPDDLPIPFSPPVEMALVPTPEDVVAVVRKLVANVNGNE